MSAVDITVFLAVSTAASRDFWRHAATATGDQGNDAAGGVGLRFAAGPGVEGADVRVRTDDAGSEGVTLRSPGGLIVNVIAHEHDNGSEPPATFGEIDQVCIDIPADRFDAEAAFWHELTGFERRPGRLPEFEVLAGPTGLGWRILLQRLDERPGPTRFHLDFACGEHVAAAVIRHRQLGASVQRVHELWTTMADPAGLAYCITSRPPTGSASLVARASNDAHLRR